jgi:hypothetical protein
MAEPKIYTTVEWGVRTVNKNFLKSAAKGIVIHNTENPNRTSSNGNVRRADRI